MNNRGKQVSMFTMSVSLVGLDKYVVLCPFIWITNIHLVKQ